MLNIKFGGKTYCMYDECFMAHSTTNRYSAKMVLNVPVHLPAQGNEPPALKASSALHWAVGASVAVHALLLAVKFASPPEKPQAVPPPMLTAVLVNADTKQAPTKASVMAQANLDAGGELEKGWMPTSPLERGPTVVRLGAKASPGAETKNVEALENEIARMMTGMKMSPWKAPNSSAPEAKPEESTESARMAIELAARIAEQASAYASRPKKAFVGLQATQSDLAAWVEAWQRKIEAMGTEFYPERARGRVRGTLILTAAIRRDGQIESIQIDRSSGHRLLDESAQRIMKLSAPFDPFDEAMSKKVDVLYITRQWRFGPAGLEKLESSDGG